MRICLPTGAVYIWPPTQSKELMRFFTQIRLVSISVFDAITRLRLFLYRTHNSLALRLSHLFFRPQLSDPRSLFAFILNPKLSCNKL
jgi:hypothetical protein